MRFRLSDIFVSYALTILLLLCFEVTTATILPLLGWYEYRLTFNVIVIIFFAIRLNMSFVPWMILGLQLIHSVFSIEGWAVGTFAGLGVMILASYLKDLIHLTNALMTMIVAIVFQTFWYLLVTFIICLKISSFDSFTSILWSFLPSSLFLSLIAPLIFWSLEKIWKTSNDFSHSGVEI